MRPPSRLRFSPRNNSSNHQFWTTSRDQDGGPTTWAKVISKFDRSKLRIQGHWIPTSSISNSVWMNEFNRVTNSLRILLEGSISSPSKVTESLCLSNHTLAAITWPLVDLSTVSRGGKGWLPKVQDMICDVGKVIEGTPVSYHFCWGADLWTAEVALVVFWVIYPTIKTLH